MRSPRAQAAALSALLFACSEDAERRQAADSSTDSAASREAAADAQQVVADAARDAQSSTIDGGGFDASPAMDASGSAALDAAPVNDARSANDATDASLRGFALTLRKAGQPARDVPVLFHDQSGAISSHHSTNAEGRVESLRAPSMVTVWTAEIDDPDAPERMPMTFADLEEGDRIEIALPVSESQATVTHYPVTWQNGDGRGMTVNIGGCSARVPYDDTTRVLRVPLTSKCVARAKAVFANWSWDNDMGTHVRELYFVRNPPSPSAMTGPLDLGAPRAKATVTIRTDPPTLMGSHAVFAVVGDVLYPLARHTANTYPDVPGHYYPKDFPDSLLVLASVNLQPLGCVPSDSPGRRCNFGHRTLLVNRAPFEGELALDFAQALPAVEEVTVTGRTERRPTLQWTTPFETQADYGSLTLSFRDPASGELVKWAILFDPDRSSIRVPAIPPPFNAPPYATTSFDLAFDDWENIRGYRDMLTRPQAAGAPRPTHDGFLGLTAPVEPTLRGAQPRRTTSWTDTYVPE